MKCRIEIRRIGELGSSADRTECLGTDTVTDAIALARTAVTLAPPAAHPLSVDIFDNADRLVLSYTSSARGNISQLN